LEKRGVEALDMQFELGGQFGERVLADGHAVDRDPFDRRQEVRRRVEADTPPLGPELVRDKGARRALPVRTTDVDGREMPLRMAEHVEEPLGWAKAPLDTTGLSGEEVLNGVFEGQSAASAGHAP